MHRIKRTEGSGKIVDEMVLLLFMLQGILTALTSKTMAVWVRGFPHYPGSYASSGAIMTIDVSDNIVSPWQPSVVFDSIIYSTRKTRQWAAGSEGWNRSPSDNAGSPEVTGTLVSVSQLHMLAT
jgi:hypothetical protein